MPESSQLDYHARQALKILPGLPLPDPKRTDLSGVVDDQARRGRRPTGVKRVSKDVSAVPGVSDASPEVPTGEAGDAAREDYRPTTADGSARLTTDGKILVIEIEKVAAGLVGIYQWLPPAAQVDCLGLAHHLTAMRLKILETAER